MKILYDHQIFTRQNYGGISRYFCELIDQFSQNPDLNVTIALRASYNENLCNQPSLNPYWSNKSHLLSSSQIIPYIQKNIHINLLKRLHINQSESVRLLKKQDFDIFHPTEYNPYFLKHLQKKPYVLTVYDMIHELFPEKVKKDNTAIQKTKIIEGATKIIAISDNTKTDIIRFYDIEPQKIEVIHLATSLQKYTPDISLNLPQKYILFVGNRGFYKNFTFFLNSISSLLNDEKDLCLICAGGGVFSYNEIHLLNDLNIKNRVIHYPIVNDSTLSQLYRKAILFVFPSLYEGFGVPVLEAFSCGCPVAASNCSSIPEVGGEAMNYFDPNNSDSIQKGVEEIVHNHSLQDSMRIKGYQRLELFSWEKTALNTKKVYDNLLSQ